MLEKAKALAAKFAEKSPQTLASLLELLYSNKVYSYEGSLKLEAKRFGEAIESEDAKEGIQHFSKKESLSSKANKRDMIMNLFVLMKRTFDTEEKIVIETGKIQDDGAEWIINPYDEYAIEEAIQLKEKHGGTITAVTVGGEEAEKELRTALAMGCDQAVLINIEDDLEEPDQYSISQVLYHYMKDQEFDLILGGNVAIDGGSGQVAPRLAELLDIPCITTITKLEINGTDAEAERDVEGDVEKMKTTLPLLVTAQQA